MRNASAVLHGPHDVRLEDRPVPRPGAGEVLVEIAAVGICGSDLHCYEHGRIGDYVVSAPMVIGHESGHTLVEVGADEGDATGRGQGRQTAAERGGCTGALEQDVELLRQYVVGADRAEPEPAGASEAELAMGADSVALAVPLVQGRELTITGVFRYANAYPLAVQLIASGAVDVDDVITHRCGIEDTEDALTRARRERESLKAMVHPVGATSAPVLS